MSVTARARLVAEVDPVRTSVWFWCDGCETHHSCWIQAPPGSHPQWTWNSNMELPTISPSVLVTYEPKRICHSFVRDGKIQFLSDCTHALSGQTIDLSPIAESMGSGATK